MAPRTRSVANSPVKKASATTVVSEEEHDPVKVLITLKNISPDSRIISLPHPRDSAKRRFLFCHQTGLHEITKTTVPPTNPQSILFSTGGSLFVKNAQSVPSPSPSFSAGYVNKDAEILTTTPFDIVFVLLKYLCPETLSTEKSLFQPLDDLFEVSASNDGALHYVLKNGCKFVEQAMLSICETIDAGDEKMFRYNEQKVLQLILSKAQRAAANGLPASLEERFVTRALEAPVLSIKTENSTLSVTISEQTPVEEGNTTTEKDGSQSSTASTTAPTVFSETSTVTTISSSAEELSTAEVVTLQRTRIAFKYIASSYLPHHLAQRLEFAMSQPDSPINFGPLDEEIKRLASLRAEIAASRLMTDFSRKRGLEDDEAAEVRAEKKKKQEEEEKKRKANESRGVRDLKKVNVTGMKKMSHFFIKKPTESKLKT